MHGSERTVIQLSVDPRSKPITGALRAESGKAIEFAGWVGLATALEALLDKPDSKPAPFERVSAVAGPPES